MIIEMSKNSKCLDLPTKTIYFILYQKCITYVLYYPVGICMKNYGNNYDYIVILTIEKFHIQIFFIDFSLIQL